ncbi:MAG: aminotransferase class I/II-fold pyridoxal phosphate-dependent enzyme [Clostridia bacterium]|nr:aminotransferase class I/II-fold pyridoxal phosphate-dependent enzyme [Clostridia bacterium]
MQTPIVDFVRKYADKNGVRAHMPGHKGKSLLGAEKGDITEISGADVLYNASGIIKQSQDNASKLFGTYATFYSTEGSSLCIKAMLYLVAKGKRNPTVLALRNAHKTFVYGCALLGIEPVWVYPKNSEHLCECNVSADDIDEALKSLDKKPFAVYVTSPDYLGNMLDIQSIATVCDRYGVPLIVDNAHGAYLAFIKENEHPIKKGAAMCCDSAHKTLSALTGGAYLHIGDKGKVFADGAKNALSLFASTSPSYLILQSLDLVNADVEKNLKRFEEVKERVKKIRINLENNGFVCVGNEPFKLTLDLVKSNVLSENLAYVLDKNGIECEMLDNEYAVFMFSTASKDSDFKCVQNALLSVQKTERKPILAFEFNKIERVMSVREAIMSESERVSVSASLNRVCASPTVSCPPAVPIVVSGERITQQSIALFARYGIDEIEVVKE